MEYSEVLKKNKDLDLRRFGKNEYTKALAKSTAISEEEVSQEPAQAAYLPIYPFVLGELVGFLEGSNVNYGNIGLVSSETPIPPGSIKDWLQENVVTSLEKYLYPILKYDENIVTQYADNEQKGMYIEAYKSDYIVCFGKFANTLEEIEIEGEKYLIQYYIGE